MYVDAFLADAAAAYRAELAHPARTPRRGAAEDAIALLTDYRLADADAGTFELMLARMTRGRSPVALIASRPETIAADLTDRWQAYQQRNAALPQT